MSVFSLSPSLSKCFSQTDVVRRGSLTFKSDSLPVREPFLAERAVHYQVKGKAKSGRIQENLEGETQIQGGRRRQKEEMNDKEE